MAAAFRTERITKVHHWNDSLFTITTTRDPGLRFENGQFVMIGLHVDGKNLLRAYSIASPNYEDSLEFFSIKVQNGPLTSRLQHVKVGDELLVGVKPTGTLVLHDLKPAKHLYLLSTGTGLAPFLSTVRDPETYERFEKIVMIHGVRNVDDLAYRDYFENALPNDEALGELVRQQLIYYPTVTREPFRHQGRLTDLLDSGKLCDDIGLPHLNPETDRAMICGSPQMLADCRSLLDRRGFEVSAHIGVPGDYVFERAFVEK